MKHRMSCESLGNLCVVQMYKDERKVNPCRVFKDYRRIPTSSDDDRLPLPWIYYGEGDAFIAMNRKKITSKYTIRPGSRVCIYKLIMIILYLFDLCYKYRYRSLILTFLSNKSQFFITYGLCREIALKR